MEPPTGGRWYLDALARWAANVLWMREPARFGELVAEPWRTVAFNVGDCDDVAAAVAAFAAVAGFPAAVATYDVSQGFAHCVALVGGSWLETGRDLHPAPARVGTAELAPVYAVDQTGMRPFNEASAYVVTVRAHKK